MDRWNPPPTRRALQLASSGLQRLARSAAPGSGGNLYLLLAAAATVAVFLVLLLAGLAWLIIRMLSGWHVLSQQTAASVLTGAISMTALVGASLGAVYAFRKQILVERDGVRADQQAFSDRYVKAAELLANERAPAKLAGLHSLATLADDWAEGRGSCAMVVCSYLRLPNPGFDEGNPDPGDREVRRAAWKTIGKRLKDPNLDTSWHGQEFDFSGGQFENVDLDLTRLEGVRMQFRDCIFKNGEIRLRGSRISHGMIDFTGAKFYNMKVLAHDMRLDEQAFIFFDETVIHESTFSLERVKLGEEGGFYLRNAEVMGTKFYWDARDDVDFFLQGPHSIIDGEVDFSESRLTEVAVYMHSYSLTGRLVFNDVVTDNVEISAPSRMSGHIYVNLDVIPKGRTELRVGPGKMDGGDLRIRPGNGAPGSLSVDIRAFDLAGGELLVSSGFPVWARFALDLVSEPEGSLIIPDKFPPEAEIRIDRKALAKAMR